MIYCKYINANMYDIAVHSHVRKDKTTFLKYCFRMEALQSRRHCHGSVKHVII